MKFPLVTCVILTYNNFKNIKFTLKSVMEQNYPFIELIISDDASACFPKNKIEEFIYINKKENFKKILILRNEKNLGTVKNFNRAIRQSKGRYIIGLAGDDAFFEKSTIYKIVKKFYETKANILCCRRMSYKNENIKDGVVQPEDVYIPYLKRLDTPSKQYKAAIMKRTHGAFCGAAMYYDKNFLLKRGLFDENYVLLEDLVICLQSTRDNQMILFSDDIISIYYKIGEGVSTSKVRNFLLEIDDLRAFNKEVLPYFSKCTLIERRFSKFSFMLFQEYHNSRQILKKILFLIKYMDMYLLSRYYKYYDKFLLCFGRYFI